ncbi:S8 family serine peptidase [Pelagicoccus albus]|uniref:S8 family serine peptidase n=1 Tax=Pelagicoccus albus TaxID=415222 RepID=A0A7X1B776_9BACT|nr:S8 family serine peptidase [Pelagicoccus albus]MBC2606941.1 S8 family serine peptidase [Pelagicoccus albus]
MTKENSKKRSFRTGSLILASAFLALGLLTLFYTKHSAEHSVSDKNTAVGKTQSHANISLISNSHLAWPRKTGPEPVQRYFQEPAKALEVDPTRIAIRAASEESLIEICEQIDGSFPVAHPLPGWIYIDTSELWRKVNKNELWSANDFSRTLTMGVLENASVSYATPVFFDNLGDPLMPQQAILLGLSPSTSESQAIAIAQASAQGSNIEFIGETRRDLLLKVSLSNGFDIVELANELSHMPEFIYAEPDMLMTGHIPAAEVGSVENPEGAELNLGEGYKPDPSLEDPQWGESLIAMPNDPLLSASGGWGLVNSTLSDFDMHALEAWDYTTGDSSVIVVVIDNGIEPSHPDLNQWTGNGKDFTPDPVTDGRPYTSNDKHGTAVAGCVSGKMNNGIGATGIAPSVKVASARPHYNGQSNGSFSTSYSWVASAINWAQTIGAKVTVNSNSYGGSSSAIASAYSNTRAAGITHFAAAGNSGAGSISYPSNLSTVLSIGASSKTGSKASFSQYGTGLEFLAPGQAVTTTDRTGSAGYSSSDYATVNGTSFATPYAGGVAALLYSYNSEITPDEVTAAMRSGCVDMGNSGYDTTNGYGHLSARNALELIGIQVEATSINEKVLLSWSDPANSGMANSTIYIRCSTSGFPASSSDGTQVYTGTASQFEHTGLTAGQTYYYTFWGNDGSSYASFGASVTASIEAVGDVVPIFLQNLESGYVSKWLINDSGVRVAGGLAHGSPMSSGWTIKTTADMNGDGTKDLVLENSNTRLVSKWLLNEYGERISGGLVHSTPMGSGWSVVGAADLNGDSIEDLLLENSSTRLVSKWLINSSGVRSSGGLVYSSPMGTGWTIAGTADLNGDGIDDVLLQNAQSGYVSKWLINSSGVRASGGLVHASPMSTGWSIAGTADLNGDGIEDVLLQNLRTGYVSKWLINSSGVRSSGGLVHSSPMSSGWSIVAIGDLNADNIDDIILMHSGTQLVSKWILNSSGVRSEGGLVHDSAMATNWEIAAYGD